MKLLSAALLFLLVFGCASQTINQTNYSYQNYQQNQAVNQYSINSPQLEQSLTDQTEQNNAVLTADTKFPELPKYNFSNATTSDGKIMVYYFYSPYCEWCIEIRPIIDRLETKYNASVSWIEFNILTQNGTLAYIEMAKGNGLDGSQRTVPRVLVNKTILTGTYDISMNLEKVIEPYQNKG